MTQKLITIGPIAPRYDASPFELEALIFQTAGTLTQICILLLWLASLHLPELLLS